MGYKCDVCEQGDGAVFCFADQAVMCSRCDQRVHSVNKLVQKHERVSLTTNTEKAVCDICQEEKAVMFCSEDRAIICRRCDLMIHTANEFTAKHHRFMLSSCSVGLRPLPDVKPSDEPTIVTISANGKEPAHSHNTANTTVAGDRQGGLVLGLPHGSSSGKLIQNTHDGQQPTGARLLTVQSAQDAAGGMTLAAELLGMPHLEGFSAKDIDAAYLADEGSGWGDLDGDLSALLAVPDLDFPVPEMPSAGYRSSASYPMAGGTGGHTVQTGLPSQPGHRFHGSGGDGVVPDIHSPNKRPRY
ncbi:hypothetical protein WJX72_007406 [[Myrmecia] bisecta]|uniref:B box-type domain-containing protein n=1 Tax=[Myrmecia] bisecta TaxID=41462 RepID=A0AAW1R762_9CHLO